MLWLIRLLEGLSPPSSGRLITLHSGFPSSAHRCDHLQLPLGIAASASTSIFILPGAGQMGITSVFVQICRCELTSKFKKNRFSHFLLHKVYFKKNFLMKKIKSNLSCFWWFSVTHQMQVKAFYSPKCWWKRLLFSESKGHVPVSFHRANEIASSLLLLLLWRFILIRISAFTISFSS